MCQIDSSQDASVKKRDIPSTRFVLTLSCLELRVLPRS